MNMAETVLRFAKAYPEFVLRHTNLSRVLALNALYVVWVALVMPFAANIISQANGPRPLDLSFAYSASDAFSRIAQFDGAGRQGYMVFLGTADVIYPIIYTVTLSFTAAYLAKKLALEPRRAGSLISLPLIIFVFDILENFSISMLLWSFPVKIVPLAWAASAFTTLKWVFVALVIAMILVLLLRVIAVNIRALK